MGRVDDVGTSLSLVFITHSAMTIHAVWVINKAGGLVFNRYYSGVYPSSSLLSHRADTLPKLEPNALLILAGTLHGIHAITARLSPAPQPGVPSAGLQSFEAEGWGGSVYLTPTGELLSGVEIEAVVGVAASGEEEWEEGNGELVGRGHVSRERSDVQARRQGMSVRVARSPISRNDRAVTEGGHLDYCLPPLISLLYPSPRTS